MAAVSGTANHATAEALANEILASTPVNVALLDSTVQKFYTSTSQEEVRE